MWQYQVDRVKNHKAKNSYATVQRGLHHWILFVVTSFFVWMEIHTLHYITSVTRVTVGWHLWSIRNDSCGRRRQLWVIRGDSCGQD